ncbi:hypothetical protein CBR_g24218 [Chara braunii]|uniref:Germin-like protein n=1 Tax=Chara braunii TaxID=69332 RepID=A0A388L634_CHABU|nr:hypothetical protein CBR_g24218 [Chara braunii]|eukprot:GBG77771.1 hypothetical protein CBR_g24218 [Chara braunii]
MARVTALFVTTLLLCLDSFVFGDPAIAGDFELVGRNATAADFVFTGLRNVPSAGPGLGFTAVPVNFRSMPILRGQGISYTYYKYAPCGQNPPHLHPRAAELLYVIKGNLTVGLVDSSENLYVNDLKAGDVAVFPRGLVHWQQNLSKEETIAILAFTDSNPGVVAVNRALFSSKVNVPDYVLQTAFGLSKGDVGKIKASTPLGAPLGKCINECGGCY